MSNRNRNNPQLNTLQSMFNLGNQPIIPGQCRQNLRFINQESSNARNRFRLRRAFGNRGIPYSTQNVGEGTGTLFPIQGFVDGNVLNNQSWPITPFRATFNAGDIFGSVNKAPWNYLLHNGSNQINLPTHHGAGDGTHTVKINNPLTGAYGGSASAYSGNPRFVYDGSDYARFKKLQAINRNYNDITFGGDQHSASQQAYRRVIR